MFALRSSVFYKRLWALWGHRMCLIQLWVPLLRTAAGIEEELNKWPSEWKRRHCICVRSTTNCMNFSLKDASLADQVYFPLGYKWCGLLDTEVLQSVDLLQRFLSQKVSVCCLKKLTGSKYTFLIASFSLMFLCTLNVNLRADKVFPFKEHSSSEWDLLYRAA